MKKIATYIIGLLLLIFVIDRAFVWLFRTQVFSSTYQGESGGSTNYLLDKASFDFLVLGSSRARHQIDPKLLSGIYGDKGFNAGINGAGGLIYNNLLLHLLIGKAIKPKLIVLQLDAYPYFEAGSDNASKEVASLYPFIGESEAFDTAMQKYLGYEERVKLLLHSYRFNGKMLNVLYNHRRAFPSDDYDGFFALRGVMDSLNTTVRRFKKKPFVISEMKRNALLEIVDICRSNRIRLAIVMPPSFQNLLHSDEANHALIEILGRNGHTEVHNFSDVNKMPALQAARVWRDPTHLNAEGAEIFTRMLRDSLLGR